VSARQPLTLIFKHSTYTLLPLTFCLKLKKGVLAGYKPSEQLPSAVTLATSNMLLKRVAGLMASASSSDWLPASTQQLWKHCWW
jgi:hypothetical protein